MDEDAGRAIKERRYRAKVTGRHAITLPADLCRRLAIDNGDIVELHVAGQQATLMKVDDAPLPPARGILRGYFEDAEAVYRYIEEERRGWAEREQHLEDLRSRYPQPENPSDD